MVEEFLWLRPFVRPELPFLSSRHDANDPLPTDPRKINGESVLRILQSLNGITHQASSSPPNLLNASTLSTTKYLTFLVSIVSPVAPTFEVIRAWLTTMTSSAVLLRLEPDPAAVVAARRASSEVSKLREKKEGLKLAREERGRKGETHIDSSRNFLTLCIVISAVELGEMMMIGSRCFFFGNFPPAPLAAKAAAEVEPEPDLDAERSCSSFSLRSLRRGTASARAESKFCFVFFEAGSVD